MFDHKKWYVTYKRESTQFTEVVISNAHDELKDKQNNSIFINISKRQLSKTILYIIDFYLESAASISNINVQEYVKAEHAEKYLVDHLNIPADKAHSIMLYVDTLKTKFDDITK